MAIVDVIPSLVPSRRFGAALHAHRVASGAGLSALSRRCQGWWSPDELLEVERGAVRLDDASVVSFCRIYGLSGRGIAAAGDLEVILDRSDSADLAGSETGDVDREDLARRAVARLGVVASIVGLDPQTVAASTTVLDALDIDRARAEDLMRRTLDDSDSFDGEVELVEDRVAVPSVGLSIAETPRGALLLVRRAGGAVRACPGPVPAAGPLRWFTSVPIAA